MPVYSLPTLSAGTPIFVDANILVYGINGRSIQCHDFLERCSQEKVVGVCLYEVVNEATHRFMLGEAINKKLIAKESAASLRQKYHLIPTLTDYWQRTERIFKLNLLIFSSDESLIRAAQIERQSFGLLTNDSMIVACMRQQGISAIATCDSDFEQVSGISVFRPDDLP